jgi:hypothetical protein
MLGCSTGAENQPSKRPFLRAGPGHTRLPRLAAGETGSRAADLVLVAASALHSLPDEELASERNLSGRAAGIDLGRVGLVHGNLTIRRTAHVGGCARQTADPARQLPRALARFGTAHPLLFSGRPHAAAGLLVFLAAAAGALRIARLPTAKRGREVTARSVPAAVVTAFAVPAQLCRFAALRAALPLGRTLDALAVHAGLTWETALSSNRLSAARPGRRTAVVDFSPGEHRRAGNAPPLRQPVDAGEARGVGLLGSECRESGAKESPTRKPKRAAP